MPRLSVRISAIILTTVVFLLLGELTGRLLYGIRDRLRGTDDRASADALARTPWKDRYFVELNRFEAAWHSYGYWRGQPVAGEFINVDDRGLRHTWNPAPCGTGAAHTLPRIYMFGGSTMWGVGARDDFTIPSELARALAQAGRPACVTSFGQWGFVNSQELVELVIALRDGDRPDVVIFYDGDNDAFSAFQQRVAGLPQNEANRRREFNVQSRPGEMIAWTTARLLTHSSLFRLAESLRPSLAGDPDAGRAPADPALAREVVAKYSGNLRVIEALADAYRFRPIFYWQPLVFDKHVQTPYETARARWDAQFGRFWHAVEGEVQAANLSAGFRFHNLGDAFAAEINPIFVDFAHVSEEGNRVLAGRMSSDVIAAIDSER